MQGAIAADVRGGDVKIIGCHWPIVPHGLMVKADIDTIEDLKGKSIAVSSPGSFPDMLARVALAKFNFDASDVTLAAVGGDRDRYTALVGGVVDAAVVSNEYLPLPSSKGLKMLLDRQGRRTEFPAHLHVLDRQKAGRAARGRDPLSHRAVEGAALRAVASRRDHRARRVEATASQGRRSAPGLRVRRRGQDRRDRTRLAAADGQARLDAGSAGRARPDPEGRRSQPRWSTPKSARTRWSAPANSLRGHWQEPVQ